MSDQILLRSIGKVISTRTTVKDDNWDSETSCVELDAATYTSDALAGLIDFSHAEIIFHMDQVDPLKIEENCTSPKK